MSKKKRAVSRAASSRAKQQGGGLSSLAIPVVVGLVVIAIIVGAILSIENRRPVSAAVPGTLSVPVVTTLPRSTTAIPYPAVERVSVRDAKAKLDKGQAVLVDVRSKQSYDQSHPVGAISIPESEVDARLSELPRDKDVIFY